VTKVRAYSMLPEAELVLLGYHVLAMLSEGLPGAFVECGVWRGGSAFLMADLLRRAHVHDRKVWLFDSFEGLPEPKEIDGRAASAYAAEKDSPANYYNCSASLEEVKETARHLELAPYTECVKGWFAQTLPSTRERVGPIALLRIDADWHDSVRCCLDQLYDQVVPGGLITFDDYYIWEGCTIAIHEFLGERRLATPLYQRGKTVYLRK